jgi:hypothetical protein
MSVQIQAIYTDCPKWPESEVEKKKITMTWSYYDDNDDSGD